MTFLSGTSAPRPSAPLPEPPSSPLSESGGTDSDSPACDRWRARESGVRWAAETTRPGSVLHPDPSASDGRWMDDTALREQLSNLTSLCALTMLMSDRRDERQILDLAASAVASLTACTLVAGCLASEDMLLRSAAGHPLVQHELSARLAELDGADGPVPATGEGWARAVALRSVGGLAGYLVVAADREPTCDQSYLLTILAQQTGCALTNAALHRRERASAAELRRLNAELAGLNDRLAATVADLEQRRNDPRDSQRRGGLRWRARPASPRPCTTSPGCRSRWRTASAICAPGQARTSPAPYPRLPARAAGRAAGRGPPQRAARCAHRDRVIVAGAQPRDEVLGVLALVDRGHRAGELGLFALEHGARGAGDGAGAPAQPGRERAAAAPRPRRRPARRDRRRERAVPGRRARPRPAPHRTRSWSLRWSGAPSDESLTVAVEHAATQVLDAGALVARRSRHGRAHRGPRPDRLAATGTGGSDLHRPIATLLRSRHRRRSGWGGVCTAPVGAPALQHRGGCGRCASGWARRCRSA